MIKENFVIIKNYMALIEEKTVLVFLLFFSSISGHLLDLLVPVAASQIVDMVTLQSYSRAYFWTFLLAVFYLLYNGAWYFNYRLYALNYQHIHKNLQSRLLSKLSSLSDSFYSKVSKGKIINTNIVDIDNLSDLIDIVCETLIISIKIIIIAFIFLKTSLFIGLFVLLLNIFYINVLDINNKQGSIHLEGQKKYADKVTDTLAETLEGISDVQSYNLMPRLNKKFDLYESKWRLHFLTRYKYVARQNGLLLNIVDIGKTILYVLLIILTIKGKIEVDTLLLLVSYFELLVSESTQLMEYSKKLRDTSVSIQIVLTILNYKNENDFNFGTNDTDNIFGLVEFRDVSFSYHEKEVFKHFNLIAKPNSICALFGESGSGKSTFLELMLRSKKISSGSIFIDGINIYDYNGDIYYKNVTCINQNSYIFSMSILENLSLVDSNKKNQIEVCKRVGIHDFILTLPDDYHTKISEKSTILTTEKKLLISLARALLTKAEIIVIDEVLDDLESNSLLNFCALLEDLKIDHTIILLTHDEAIANIASEVYALKDKTCYLKKN